jgi:hypothetical protein
MPTISRFFGIAILVFFDDHGFPHFHAELHQNELEENWRRARAGETLQEIEPLQ